MTVTCLPVWTLGDRLRKLRKDAKISRDDMATRLGVIPNTVSNYESSKTSPLAPTVEIWVALCCEKRPEWDLAVAMEWVNGITDDRPPSPTDTPSDQVERPSTWNSGPWGARAQIHLLNAGGNGDKHPGDGRITSDPVAA